jgi:pimeloyl-ACP methyl ester carboxylesterase
MTATAAPALPTAPADAERSIDLPGRRTLAYGLYGAPAGPLVVVLDGPGSRGLARAASSAAAAAGIRLAAPDRPGFGASTPLPGRKICDWPADHRALLDALEVDRAGILAQSGGTPYALAAAAAMPTRTIAIAFAGALADIHDPGAFAEAGAQLRRGAKLARRAPWLLRAALRSASRNARKDPEKAARKVAKDAPPADARVLEDPALWALHVRATGEVLAHPDAIAHEIRLLTDPPCFDIADVRAPVSFWSGERDATHPPAHSHRLALALGGDAPVTVVPDAATFGLMPHYADAVRFAAGPRQS